MPGEFVLPVVVAIVLGAVLVLVATGLWRLCRLGLHLFAFPGVVVHEFAHASACRAVGVPVVDVVYFRFGNPPGYVRHATPARYRQSVVISVAPFLVNTVVAFGSFLALGLLVSTNGGVGTLDAETALAGAVLAWVGLSVGMHAFPSTGDARTLWVRFRQEWRRSPVVLLGVPVIALIYLVNLLSWLWAHVLYALALFVGALYLVGTLSL